jgi:peptide deformylase
MTVHRIRLRGDPVLRPPCDRVTRSDVAVTALVADLLEGVRLPGHAGLATHGSAWGLRPPRTTWTGASGTW